MRCSLQQWEYYAFILSALCPVLYSFSPWTVRIPFGTAARHPSRSLFSTYRPYAEHAWAELSHCSSHLDPVPIDASYANKRSLASTTDASATSIEIRALEAHQGPIRYARYALLSTEPSNAKNAIEVLNICVFPRHKDIPVWSADFVSLPGNRHLLLLDAQPMNGNTQFAHQWKDWFDEFVPENIFPWGGDLPEKVKPFVSEHALWTRLGNECDVSTVVAGNGEGPLYQAYCRHLDLYMGLLFNETSSSNNELHQQDDYIQYRLANDPARPMLKRLFGEEWTEHVLETFLFPQDQSRVKDAT